jgi:tRNA pseudouridine55 synthase
MNGLLVIDKPAGPTSHDIVACLRRVLGERRIGHTGTLDPAASGVLPLVLGRATRLARFLSASDKSYEAVIRVGVATDTYDGEGAPVGTAHDGACPPREAIEAALGAFRGSFLQQPPAYSAKKVAGRRSYKMARASARGRSEREGASDLPDPVRVIVHRLDLVGLDADTVTLRVDCSAGFYVRALAHDLGQRLGSGAHLAALRRTSSGDFTLADALSFEAAERDHDLARAAVVPLAQMLPRWLSVVLTDEGARRVAHGRDVGPDDISAGVLPSGQRVPLPAPAKQGVRLLDQQGELIGIALPGGSPGVLHPSVVLV